MYHKAWLESTQSQRNEYVIRALLSSAGADSVELGAVLSYLLGRGGADPNAVCESLDASPLHLGILFGQSEAVRVLMRHGGDVHRRLTIRVSLPFDNTTPLEYAIGSRSASLWLIRLMLLNSPLKNYDTESESDSDSSSVIHPVSRICDQAAALRTEALDIPALAVSYTQAACQRHKPEVFQLLFGRVGRLDPNLRDREGNTPLSLFCIAVEMGLEDSDFSAEMIAARSAGCVRELLRLGVNVALANDHGMTPLERVRRIMEYTGSSEYLAEVARVWRQCFVIEGSVLREA